MKVLTFSWLIASLFASCFMSALAVAQNATPVKVNTSTAGNPHGSCMHVGRDGTIYVSWFANSADIYFARSTDRGATFTPPVRVSKQVTTNDWTSRLQRVPNFAIDTKGVIHLAWVEARTSGPLGEQQDVWYVRSTDNGATWTQPISIMDADDSSTYAQDFSAIAVDSSDNIYVSFLDAREVQRGTADVMQMYMIKSTNAGASWLPPVKANRLPQGVGGTCECCKEDIAVSKEGHVYIAFRSNIYNRRDVWIARSMDGGVTWDSTILAQDGIWMINACPTTGPNITLDRNENLILSWRDSRDSRPSNNVYLTMLPKNSDKAFRNIIMNASGVSPNWPDVAVSPTGVVLLGYQFSTDKGDRLEYRVSTNGANEWMRDTTVVGTVPNTQDLLNTSFDRDGNMYVAWDDNGNIYVSKLAGGVTASAPGAITLHPAEIAREPIMFRWSPPAGLRRWPFVWYDFKYSGPTSDSLADIRDTVTGFDIFTPGKYTYTVTAHTLTGDVASSGSFEVPTQGVKSEANSSQFILFPNPSGGRSELLSLTASQPSRLLITLYDLLGKEVWHNAQQVGVGKHSIQLDLAKLPAGEYDCELIIEGKAQHQKLILK